MAQLSSLFGQLWAEPNENQFYCLADGSVTALLS